MGGDERTTVVQISNISPSASRDQLYHMFSYLGRIHEFKIYPSEMNPVSAFSQTKICYIRYERPRSVATAQHMTNTVFVDRALIVVPVAESEIPDEDAALKLGGPSLPGQRQLPAGVTNEIRMIGKRQALVTHDPKLVAFGLPPYPPLPPQMEEHKVEEIRRTVYVSGVPNDTDAKDLMQFLNKTIGEVMYLRMAGPADIATRFAYVEFSSQHSVPVALQNCGLEYAGGHLRFHHSTVGVVKPAAKVLEQAVRDSDNHPSSTERQHSSGEDESSQVSHSKSKRRSRSRSKRHSSRSRNKKHRSRSRKKRHRSRSSARREKHSKTHKSRSRSRHRHRSKH